MRAGVSLSGDETPAVAPSRPNPSAVRPSALRVNSHRRVRSSRSSTNKGSCCRRRLSAPGRQKYRVFAYNVGHAPCRRWSYCLPVSSVIDEPCHVRPGGRPTDSTRSNARLRDIQHFCRRNLPPCHRGQFRRRGADRHRQTTFQPADGFRRLCLCRVRCAAPVYRRGRQQARVTRTSPGQHPGSAATASIQSG